MQTVQEHFGYPSGALGTSLQQERRQSMVFLGSKSDADRASMESARLVTDRQIDLFRRLASDHDARKAANQQTREWSDEVLRRIDGMRAKRSAIDSGAVSRNAAFTDYSSVIASINVLQSSLSTLDNADVIKDAKTQGDLTRARETLSQADAVLAGALAAGRFTASEHRQFTMLVGTHRYLYDQTLPELRGADRRYYQKVVSTPEYSRLTRLEDQYTGRAGIRPQSASAPVTWKITADSVLTRFRGLELSATADAQKRIKPIATGIITRVALTGGLGLLAVIVPVIMSIWVARSIIRELGRLRRAALELSDRRLPSVIKRLRRGEEVDAAAEAPPLKFGTDEINQVGQAFNAARRTAIQSAVEEAALRRSISEVFLNLARRSQALLHRQLSLLDTMERRASEPDELEDLFRLDHLATRMRRHAEGLIILSGQAPGRGWRRPVPAVDVVRAAAAEVEDYARVKVMPLPRVAIAGPVVADLIHLLAELVENATLFSPPNTSVQISGQQVSHGLAIEIEDRGLSMDPSALSLANERLANPPDFDLSNTAQLGLFVVGRLAQRHNIKVTLRISPYGGTTAIILLPKQIIVQGQTDEEPPGLDSGQQRLTRRTQDALIPIGSVSAPEAAQPENDPPMLPGQRPSLPQRRQQGPARPYTAGRPEPATYEADTGPIERYGAGSSDTPYSSYQQQATPPPAGNPYESNPYVYDLQGSGSPENGPGTSPIPGDPYTHESDAQPRSETSTWGATDPASTDMNRDGFSTGPFRRSVFEPAADPPLANAGRDDGRPPLPRRVRQANLAPQLREDVENPASIAEAGERSPEELRTMLNSIQKGWLRGRSEADGTSDPNKEDM